MDRVVEAAVLPVYVVRDVRVLQDVIQRGVELLQVGAAAAARLHAVEDGVPRGVSRGAARVEVEARALGGQVGLRAGEAHEGDADLDVDHLVAGRVEGDVPARIDAAGVRRPGRDGTAEPGAEAAGRPVELHHEEDRVRLGGAAEAAAGERTGELVAADAQRAAAVAGR